MKDRLRIVQVITRVIVGGAQRTVLELCRGLKDQMEIHVVCGPDTGPEGSLLDELRAVARVTVLQDLRRDVHPRQDVRVVHALRRTLDDIQPAVVHTHSSKAGIVGRLAARPLPAASVHTVHGWGHTPDDHPLKRRAYVELERRAARWSDALVAVSPEVLSEGLRQRIGEPGLYEVIPEGVDFRRPIEDYATARARARQALSLDPDCEVVGWVGRFSPQKDPATLAAALRGILSRRQKAIAVLVGDGPLKAAFQEDLRSWDLNQRVRCIGLRQNARELMPAFDVLLHLSRWEGQPRVVQEALAERVPVVATRTHGVPGLVKTGHSGRVVEIGDGTAAADRTVGILEGRDSVFAPLGESEIADLEARNGIGHVLDRHLSLYHRLVATRT